MGQTPRESTPNASSAHLFGAELRRCRDRRGWSLTQVTAQFAAFGRRVHSGYLGHVELGERLPEDAQFAEIADQIFDAGGLLARLWEFADAHRRRSRLDTQADRRAVLDLAAGMFAPVASGDIVLVPYVSTAGTVEYMRISRRTFVSTGGLAAAMFAAGTFTPDDLDRLAGALDEPERADLKVADYFRSMLAAHKANDFVQSPVTRLGPVVAQTAALDRLCRDAQEPARSALRAVQAEYAEYAGWLHEETGNRASSVYWTNQATEWARAGGDYQLVSFIQGRNINIAYWAGQYQHAAELAEASRRVPWHVPPGLASLIARDGAATSAMLGDKAAAHAQLDEAADLLARRNSSGEDTVYWARYHRADHLRWHVAHCQVRLGRPDEAVEILLPLMNSMAGPRSLLALAHARAGDPEPAVAAGEAALDRTVSANALTNLNEASRALSRWEDLDSVRAFQQRVAETCRRLRQDAAGIRAAARG